MTHLVRLVFSWFILMTWLFSIANSTEEVTCLPAEEGVQHKITCKFPKLGTSDQMTWLVKLNDGTPRNLGYCEDGGCYMTNSEMFQATMTKETDGYLSTLTFVNVTRLGPIGGNDYECVHAATTPVCQPLEIFAYPTSPACQMSYISDNTTILIVCETDRVYPKASCVFYKSSDGQQEQTLTEPVSYNHSTIHHNPTYYRSTCEIAIPVVTLGPGLHVFRIIMYPMVTGGMSYGVNAGTYETTLHLPTATLGSDCPISFIQDGDNSTCTCLIEDNGYPSGYASWIFPNGSAVGSENDTTGSSTLMFSYNDDDMNQAYICSAKSVLGQNRMGVSFTPKKAAKVISFTANSQHQILEVTNETTVLLVCKASGFPPPTMRITRTGQGTTMLEEQTTNGQINFTLPITQCMDLDEYVCHVDNGGGQWMSSDRVAMSIQLTMICGIRLQNPESDNRKITAEVGENVFMAIKVSGNPEPESYSLKFQMGSSRFELLPNRYSVTFEDHTPFHGSINLALYNIQSSDLTNFTLTIKNGVGNGLDFHFSISQESDEEEKMALKWIGISIGCVLVLVVAVVVGVIWYRGWKKKKENAPTDFYIDVDDSKQKERIYKDVFRDAEGYEVPMRPKLNSPSPITDKEYMNKGHGGVVNENFYEDIPAYSSKDYNTYEKY